MEALDVGASLASLEKVAARSPIRESVDKFSRKRTELAKAAIETLATLGYARTSLREIAQNSEYSHGVLHYYFSDKNDLITCSMSYYKSICATRYDEVVSGAETPDQLLEGFLNELCTTLREEAPLHRLWYDLRAQALFEDAFAADVMAIDARLEDMIWNICAKYCALQGGVPGMSKKALYALFDGLFQQALYRHIQMDPEAASDLAREIRTLLPQLVDLSLDSANANPPAG